MLISSFATVLTRSGHTDPSRLSSKEQEEFYENRKPRSRRTNNTAPTTHPKGGKVFRKIVGKLHGRQSARTATLATNKNATAVAFKMPGSLRAT